MNAAREENYLTLDELDPRKLLPFERELEPRDENVERLPSAYVGADQVAYGGDKLL